MRRSKKKLLLCGAALVALPLLVGFKVDGTGTVATEQVDDIAEVSDAEKVAEVSAEKADGVEIGKITEQGGNTPTRIDNNPAAETPAEQQKAPTQSDTMFREYLNRFEGKTIVEIKFEGASEQTLPTVKTSVASREGEAFNPALSMRDRENIRNTGYFYEVYQTIEEIPEGILLTYHMLENPVVTDIEITGNTIYTESSLKRMVKVRRGATLNDKVLHDGISAIQEKYHGDGYIRMKLADMNVSEEGVVTLKINEGVIEGIAVKGNKKTKDKVVLREMRQKPGDVFNANLARRSMERVYNLGFFEDVNVKMNDGVEPNAVIMEINVQEKRTGTFGIGAGYSSREGFVGMISIGDKNFRGLGDSISLSYEKSADDTDAQGFIFSYRRPWLDSKETAGSIRLYNRTYEYSDYATDGSLNERYMRKYTGGELTVSRPMSEYSTNQITLRHRKDKYVRHVSTGKFGDRGTSAYDEWRKDNFGTTNSIELQHVTDTRDNIFNPTTGGRAALIGEFGGIGGDFKFQKFTIEQQAYRPAGEHSQVWALHLAYGFAHGDMTEFNQFRIGGQGSLRGYRDDQFRGSRMFTATLEYRFPLASKVQGILFADGGSAWNNGFYPHGDDKVYGSGGIGVSLNTPLGPLRLDYGRGSQGGRFHFMVGGSF